MNEKLEKIKQKYQNGISQSIIDLTAMDILQKGLKETNERQIKNIPIKPYNCKKPKSYKRKDKDRIEELKDEIKSLKEEMKKKNKEIQEYTDYWDSISDEFYRNKKLVTEYEKRYGKVNIHL